MKDSDDIIAQRLFGKYVFVYRKKRKMSRRTLGGFCGVTGNCIKKIEEGKVSPMQITVTKIALALIVSITFTHDGVYLFVDKL